MANFPGVSSRTGEARNGVRGQVTKVRLDKFSTLEGWEQEAGSRKPVDGSFGWKSKAVTLREPISSRCSGSLASIQARLLDRRDGKATADPSASWCSASG